MANFFKRLFVPSRFDAIWFAVTIHWAVAVLSVTVLPVYVRFGTLVESSVIVATVAATWCAIAATAGWKSNSKWGMLCLSVSSVVSLAFVVIWYRYDIRLCADPENFLSATGWLVLYALAASVAVWVVNLLARSVLVLVGNVFSTISESSNSERTKGLISLAAILFVLAIAGRVMPGFGSLFGQKEMDPTTSLAFSFFAGVFVWGIVLFWFPRSFAFTGKPLQKSVSILLVCFTFLPFLINLLVYNGNFTNVIAMIFGFSFMLSVIGVGGKEQNQTGAETGQGVKRIIPFPSLISWAVVTLLVLTLSVPWFYDLAIVTGSLRGDSTLTEVTELSSMAATIKWKSEGRIRPKYDAESQAVMWEVQFDDDAPNDLLSALEDDAQFSYIELHNLTPDHDLSPLRNMVKYFKLVDCEISHSQLSTLLGSAAWGQIEGRFSIVDDGTEVNTGAFNSISFQDTKPGAIKAFFDAAKCEGQLNYTIVQTKVGAEDWPAIVNAAQGGGGVHLYGGLENGFRVPKNGPSLKRVVLSDFSAEADTGFDYATRRELILDTDIRIGLPAGQQRSPEFLWKLMMLRGSIDAYGTEFKFQDSGKSIHAFAKEAGMAYKVEDNGTIHSLFYPWGSVEPDVGVLVDLKVLSFDPTWIGAEAFSQRSEFVNTRHLTHMTGLQELYFEQIFVPDNLAFLANLKSLKHIQIPSVVRKVTGAIGFDACQSLESVTFLGIPDNKSYHEISRLKNLKRFTIVNVEDDPILSQRYLEKLQEKLPEVDVKIIPATEIESLIPKAFLEHRDRVRKELREDTTWLDKALAR